MVRGGGGCGVLIQIDFQSQIESMMYCTLLLLTMFAYRSHSNLTFLPHTTSPSPSARNATLAIRFLEREREEIDSTFMCTPQIGHILLLFEW